MITVSVPEVAWTSLVNDVWRTEARKGERSVDGMHACDWERAGWYAWAPVEAPQKFAVRDAAANFAIAVAGLHHCAGFSADMRWLPVDMLLGADFTLTLPLLSATNIENIATEVCGGDPTTLFKDEDAAALTPRLLRLARRLGQTADAYICKLHELVARERSAQAQPAPIVASSTMRDEPTLERLHGMDDAVRWGLNLARDIELFRAGQILWAEVDRGVLLSGPPGCGKTLFARALAATCQVPLVTGSYEEWHGSGMAHQGDLLKAMRTTFARARESAPSILFIDEVDSFPDRSKITHRWADWEIQVVNALLAEIDGVQGRYGVVLVAACNHPHKLDPALIRSGRLDRHIRVGTPDIPALELMMREHLGTDLASINLRSVAILAAGSTGADVERLVRGSRARARRESRDLSLDDLVNEIFGSVDADPAEEWVNAVHEAGHTVAFYDRRIGKVQAVSLRRTNGSVGFTMASGATSSMSAVDVRSRLIAALAGRAAEEIVIGVPTAGAGGGAGSDLASATMIATDAALALGLDPHIGLVWFGSPDYATLPKMLRGNPALAVRIRTVLDDAYLEAVHLIKQRRRAVEAVADALVVRHALEGTEIEAIIARHPSEDEEAGP